MKKYGSTSVALLMLYGLEQLKTCILDVNEFNQLNKEGLETVLKYCEQHQRYIPCRQNIRNILEYIR